MKLPSARNFVFAAVLAGSAAHGQLILTEINSNGAGGDFWELTNVGASSVDLSNYKWIDGGQSPPTLAVPAPTVQTFPSNTTISAGEAIIIITDTTVSTTFLGAWGPLTGIQKFVGGPGLGQNDSVRLYDSNNNLVFTFSYALGGFTRSQGEGAQGGHAGASAGGAPTVSAVLDPNFGTSTPRYAAATVGTFGAFSHSTSPTTIGSPGVSGLPVAPPSVTLTVSATPSSFSESAANPASVGTVSRTGATTSALVVTLSSSDTTEATVPATVTIPIGAASVPFDITAVNDSFPDGNKSAIITASATGTAAGTTTLTVNDDGDVFVQKLLLTEVQSQQNAANVSDYWELTNISASPVSLAGYSWHDSGRSASAAQAYALPLDSSIAAGESVIFTTNSPTEFRNWWGISNDVQVFQTGGAPGLGKGDGVSLFDEGQNELFFFSYAVGGFTNEDGDPSVSENPANPTDVSDSGHAGIAAGGSQEYQAAIWVPTSGASNPRYTFATGTNFGTFQSADGLDLGSPGKTVGVPSVKIVDAAIMEGNSGTSVLSLNVTRNDITTAFSVDYTIADGTATSPGDYTATSGTLTFTADGVASIPVNITVNGDTDSEPDETVIVTLSNISDVAGTTIISKAVGIGTILSDDVIPAVIAAQPMATSIASGGRTTLIISASGSPAPTVQWYQGLSGDTSTPVGTNSNKFLTPSLTVTTSFWARITNAGGTVDSDTVTVTVVPGATEIDLTKYVRIGRYDLPEPNRTALPSGTPAHNLLCQEASGVAYNWDTDTLFIACDGGRSITQVSKTGQLIDTMTLDLRAGAPQGTDFYDPEGITYIGNGEFVFSEERDRQLVKFTYMGGGTLGRAGAKTVKLGTFVDNTGTEGLSNDPLTSGFIVLKEISPIGIFQTGVDFEAGTATNGSPTTENSVNLFDPALLGMTDVADVYALSNIPSMSGLVQEPNLLVISQEDAKVVNISRTGSIHSTLQITTDPGNPLNAGAQQHEGIAVDGAGIIYVVNENGGGSIAFPQLWVYAPTNVPNAAPTAIALNNQVTQIQENTSTVTPVKVADIAITDDGLGINTLAILGSDAAFFEISGASLFIKAGVNLDFETKSSYSITIAVDDVSVGGTPDAMVNYNLTVTDQIIEAAATPVIIVTEVAPWSSGSSPVIGSDWFEVTNVSSNAVDITGWKFDDSSNAFATSVALNGVTSIAAGESVIFIESSASNLPATVIANFKSEWLGASPPATLQIGTYQGSGIGLSTSGDEVNLFTASGTRHSGVTFGASDATAPFSTFDNTRALNDEAVSLLSEVGSNGAFLAANSNEIGSPGFSAPGALRITEVAPWSSGNSTVVAADWFEVTNIGARSINVSGWVVDDSSESPAAAAPLTGITNIAPGESVIYIETADLPAKRADFISNWFGTKPPAGLQIGAYTGSGLGLSSTSGDAVNLFDDTMPTRARRTNVSFGVSPSAAPFATFDNAAGLNVAPITQLSAVGTNGAFIAFNSSDEIGSPGTLVNPPPAPQSFSEWLTANSFPSTGFGEDSDGDGIKDGVEYFFNTNTGDPSDNANLPQVVKGAAGLEFNFTRRTSVPDLTATLVISSDLENWYAGIEGIDFTQLSTKTFREETIVSLGLLGTAPAPSGTSSQYLVPNNSSPAGASLNGVYVYNEGLVGVGRFSGERLDVFGETFGAASGLFVTDWAYNSGSGNFTGTFKVLPDRGFNADGIFSNYAARIHSLDFTFTPYYGTSAVSQGQIVSTYNNVSTKFTYQDGATTKFTTGLNPTGNATILGQTVGVVTAANGPGGTQQSLIAFDAEAIHMFPDGSGYVSDEYGTYIARFNSAGLITGITQLPESARPHKPVGILNFDSLTAPSNGRRNNQGLEGMSVSPDETRLFALMQSALVQDTGAGQQGRNNTRLYVYDIVGARRESPVLIGEYAVPLPVYDFDGNSSGLDRTAAQSEITAISNSHFLMLPRDGNGLGTTTGNPIVYKSVQLVDFSSATNILGMFDAEASAVSPSGVLNAAVKAAATKDVINMLEPGDLAKFGLNKNTSAPDSNTLNEKMEGFGLVPDLSTPAANDFFLFVANDNDFQSSNVMMVDATGALVSYGDARSDVGNGPITNDAMFYVYRLIIDVDGKRFYRMGVSENGPD